MAESPDHDQRLKVLLKEFFEQFFTCFFPAWAKHFDFTDVMWLDKEVFLAPPLGENAISTWWCACVCDREHRHPLRTAPSWWR